MVQIFVQIHVQLCTDLHGLCMWVFQDRCLPALMILIYLPELDALGLKQPINIAYGPPQRLYFMQTRGSTCHQCLRAAQKTRVLNPEA